VAKAGWGWCCIFLPTICEVQVEFLRVRVAVKYLVSGELSYRLLWMVLGIFYLLNAELLVD
jgi:hypothetical protein